MRRIFFLQLIILFNFIDGKSIAWGQSEQHYVVWESGPNTVGGTHIPNPGCVNGVSTNYSEYTGFSSLAFHYLKNDKLMVGSTYIDGSSSTLKRSFVGHVLDESNGVFNGGFLFGGNNPNLQMRNLVANTNDDSYYFSGFFSETMKFGNGCYFIQKSKIGNVDMCIVKMDENHLPLNVVTYGAAGGNCIPWHMKNDVTGNLYILGSATAAVDFDPGPGISSVSGMFLLKLDQNLNFVYVKPLNIDIKDGSMDLDEFGNIYLTGIFSGVADVDPNSNEQYILSSNGTHDGVLLKLTPNGDLLWASQFGTILGADEILLTPKVSVHLNSVVVSGYFTKDIYFQPLWVLQKVQNLCLAFLESLKK
jgi:hypothetical protein